MKFKKIFSMLIVVTFAAGLYIPSGVQGAENLSIEATSIESEEVNQSIIEENLNDKAEDPIVTAVTGFDEDVASVTLESILGKNPAANSITENLNISTDETLKNGTKITWESNMHGAIAGDAYKQRTARGKVTRHPESDRNVTLTAKFKSSDNSLTETKTFDFVVLKETEAPKVIIDETYDNLTSAELSKMGFEEIDSGKVNDDDSSFGEIKLSGSQLVFEKTNGAISQSYGVRKNFTYYEDAYDNDSDRTAVWANKLKGIYDVEWDASYENIKGNRVTERIVGKVGGGIGPVALIIVKNTEAFYTYNNYINAPKKRDLFFAGNPMNGINRKIRIIPDIQSFEMFLNNKTVPEDTTEVTSNPRNAFNTTGWGYRPSVQYIDGFTWSIAREEKAGAAVKPKKLKVTEVKKQPDLVVEGAIEQLTMDSVTDAPADVKTIKALPATLNEAKITWTSSNSEVIEILDGVATVKKPTQDTDVILTANVLNNADGFDKNKEFKLTVKAPLMDNKQEFDTDVASITIESLLGENLDKNNIKTNLVFSDSSFLYGTKVAWASSEPTVISNDGTVTRPTDADKEVTITATFTSPVGTYTENKTFIFNVKMTSEDIAATEAFENDVKNFTQKSFLGGNVDLENILYDLNIVTQIKDRETVTYTSSNENVITKTGLVLRPETDTTVKLSFKIDSIKKPELTVTKTFDVIVKKADNGSVWNLKENIAFDTIGDTGNYVIKEKGDPGKSKITCEDGIKIVQTSNAAMVENDTLKERPTITVDFSDKIKAGKKYYVETEINSNMLKGETRIMMMNSTAGEGAYIMPGSAATYFLTAKYNGKRDWVSSVVNMPLVKNTNERVGILFDSATNKLKFCRNGETASDIWFETSYGSGLSGISFSFWGAVDGKDSTITIKNVKVYECNSELDEKYKSDVESLVYEKITPQSKDVILSDLTLPKTLSNGSTITWSSSDASTISADGKVTRPETSDKSVTLTATISGFGETVVKDFVFNVVASNNLKAGFDADLERLIPASLTDEEPTKITKDLKTLPTTLFYGTNVTWETSDNTVIDETGRITRKVNQNSSAKLTATLTKGNLNAKKEFDFIVLGNIIVADGNVAFGVNSFSNAKSETENKNYFVNDSNYSTMWFTNDGNSEPSVTLDFGKSVIFSKAKLYEARDGEEYRVKNAVLETSENGKDFVKVADVGAVGDKKEVNFAIQKARYLRYRVIEKSAGNTGLYEFEVFYNPTDSDVVKKDSETFNFDIPYKISENVELPKITEYGSEIIWTSSNPAVFGNDGVVTRAKENTPITLTVKFKKGEAIAEGVKRTLMVLGTNPEKPTRPPSGGGGNGGGNNNGGTTGSVVITPPINTQDEPKEISPFSDVSTDKWSYSYIKSLYEKEIISGDENGEFKPEANMHREEFVKIIVKAFDLEVTNGECRFNDVDINEWYAPYIITAEKYGIINGVDESTFGVGEKVSRQDMAVIIARAVKTLNKTIKTQDKNIELSDMENVAEYAKESVELLIKSGVINGINGEFKAYSNATKEECAKMIYMILENIK